MRVLETPLYLMHAAEIALEQGDHMLAMDLFADATERAYADGRKDLADECALRVYDIIIKMAEIDGIKPPD